MVSYMEAAGPVRAVDTPLPRRNARGLKQMDEAVTLPQVPDCPFTRAFAVRYNLGTVILSPIGLCTGGAIYES